MTKDLTATYNVTLGHQEYIATFNNCVELVWELQDYMTDSDREYSDEKCNALITFDETGELTNGLSLEDCKIFMTDVLEVFPEIGAPTSNNVFGSCELTSIEIKEHE